MKGSKNVFYNVHRGANACMFLEYKSIFLTTCIHSVQTVALLLCNNNFSLACFLNNLDPCSLSYKQSFNNILFNKRHFEEMEDY